MRTRSDQLSGRGGPSLWVFALGLILVAGGCGQQPARVMDGAAGVDSSETRLPFVAEPTVRFEKANPPGPSRTPKPEQPGRRSAAAGPPVRLVVPRLGVDAPVIGIGAAGGILTPPGDPQTLGWWSGGAVPGAGSGGALITGHTVSSGGGAFDDLETLGAGDRVMVRTPHGQIDYKVTSVSIYRKASLAQHATRVFNQDVPGRLVLITCEDWNGSVYLSNAVVMAEPT